MDLDPKSDELKKNNQDDHNQNPPKDLKMKLKLVEDRHHLYKFDSPYPLPPQEFATAPNVEVFRVQRERVFDSSKRTDYSSSSSSSSSKRTRITKPKSAEVIDLCSDSDSDESPLEALKLLDEIVRIYSDYINHIFKMASDRLIDEQMWNFDQILCSGLAGNFAQKIQRLESEMEGMKKDSSQTKNYSLIEPRVRQIMSRLIAMQERLDRSPNIGSASKKNCTKDILICCMDEIDPLRKELHAITLRIDELKAMKMHGKKTMVMKQRNFTS